MENDILDCLEDLGYPGSLDPNGFTKAIQEGPKSVEFTRIVEWLSKELQVVIKLEGCVNAITNPDESSSFLLELSSFLKEMNCPYQSLMQGNISQRLGSKDRRLALLDFLSTELEAARMIAVDKPSKLQVEMEESPTAADLKGMIIALKFTKPPPNITAKQLFDKVENKIKEIIAKLPPNSLGKPLFTGKLSDKQWLVLANIQDAMKKEYFLRREMLLKRLDVTIQSFKWGERLKKKDQEITQAYLPKRQALTTIPNIFLSDVLAAREDLIMFEKTSGVGVRARTQCQVNKVIIGSVPDRGGRPEEQQPPPPEMPSWQQRSDPQKSGGGGFSGGDRNRVQGGGWSGNTNQMGDSRQGSGNWQDNKQGRGGYSGGHGNYNQNYQGGQARSGGYDGGQHNYGYQDGQQRSGGYDNRQSNYGYNNYQGGQSRSGGGQSRSGGYDGGQGNYGYNNYQGQSRSGGYDGNQGRYQYQDNQQRGGNEYQGGRGRGGKEGQRGGQNRGGRGGRGGGRGGYDHVQTHPQQQYGYPVYDPNIYYQQYQGHY
ncbi:protein FAM98A-like [Centruroides vittatus]|uniref:protein FAM98A-like n=1 Tax=Centruroides vittatus TaxID=120091 RepID=UPI00350EC916